MNSIQLKVLAAVCDALVDSISICGLSGCDETAPYLAMQQHGCTPEQFEEIVQLCVDAGRLTRKNHRLFVEGPVVR